MSALLDLEVQGKQHADRPVLEQIQFRMVPGEVVGLVGPSGCGKSTLLRIIAGLDRDYAGQVSVCGEPVRLHSRHVGLVFQEPRLLPWLDVAANVGLELGSRGGKDPRVQHLLREVGLADAASRWPRQLSGGMAQRAAIARGLLAEPALLLLDEPFSAVDALTRMRLQDLLLTLARRRGTALLLVTHDISEAVHLSDRVLVMSGTPGKLVADLRVELSPQRDRRDPAAARLAAEILTLLGEQDRDPIAETTKLPGAASVRH